MKRTFQVFQGSDNFGYSFILIQIVEDYKANVFQFTDLPLLCFPGQNPAVILFGLQCLEHRIKHSWNNIPLDCKQEIKNSLFKMVTNVKFAAMFFSLLTAG
ncbi:hypothetical protein FGIG_07456 [Fasciola gigantica]|uniref:Importin N-terminal domain-containing protein n=1 Tax=Fasciola gigantica TaxID=46835 RepID=A0A504Z063_FASGI|nr:hypothetical protein FGIG_07456 [Fasciola gigantica]